MKLKNVKKNSHLRSLIIKDFNCYEVSMIKNHCNGDKHKQLYEFYITKGQRVEDPLFSKLKEAEKYLCNLALRCIFQGVGFDIVTKIKEFEDKRFRHLITGPEVLTRLIPIIYNYHVSTLKTMISGKQVHFYPFLEDEETFQRPT
jgi:hypothetical protein